MSATESAAADRGFLNPSLVAGLDEISSHAVVHFTQYRRVVLPLDGFVFWLRSGSFSQAGSLHHAAERSQDEDGTLTTDAVVFTTSEEIVQLNRSSTDTLTVGHVEGVRYAFRRHGWFYANSNIWHYAGASVVAPLAIQLVDDPTQIDPTKLIVSDSLPAWLSLISYTPIWLNPPNPLITLYPSFAVPDNLEPPYGSVHIDPDGIRALQSSPLLRPIVGVSPGSPPINVGLLHNQLVAERVRVTLYGCNNEMAADFLDLVERYSYDQDIIGIMNMPAIRDGKRTWPEGMVLAQQKFIDFEISYIQNRNYAVATQLILSAQTTVQSFDV